MLLPIVTAFLSSVHVSCTVVLHPFLSVLKYGNQHDTIILVHVWRFDSLKKYIITLAIAVMMLVCSVPVLALTGEGTRAGETLSALNVVRGADQVDDDATRNQAAVILVRLAGAEKKAASSKTPTPFTDMPAWAASSIRYAYGQGWINGVTGNTFGGNKVISANAYCAFLMRMLGYTDSDFTYEHSVTFARHMGVIARDYSGDLTRGDLFELTASALHATYKDSSETVLDRLISSGTARAAAAKNLGLDRKELSARQAADRLTAAVFQLSTFEQTSGYDIEKPNGTGSGFFITSDGLAVTNYHAIDGFPAGIVTLVTGEQYPVEKVIYYDEAIDIAVLQIGTTSMEHVKTPGFVFLEVVGRNTLRMGDEVYTIGSPLGLGLAISSGIISDVSRNVDRYANPCIMSTADISQGSSGGVLMNAYGQAIGVTSGAFMFGNNMYLAVALDPVLTADLTVDGQTLAQVRDAQANKAAAA